MTSRKDNAPQDAQDAPQDAPTAPTWPEGVKVSPKALASLMGDPADAPHGLGTGATVNVDKVSKRLRSIARATIARYQDEGYTVHEYDEDEARALVAEYRNKGRRSSSTADAVRSAAGMKGTTDA